jgi:hypothetical protein
VIDPITFQMYDGSGFREAAPCLGWELRGSGWLKATGVMAFFPKKYCEGRGHENYLRKFAESAIDK